MRIIGFPPMTSDEFYAIPTGSYIYNYGADQCVALANLYTVSPLQLPLPSNIQSAFQWWTTFGNQPNLYNNFVQITENPQRGDIFIGRYGPYQAENGHIGVVERSWDGSTFGTMENGYWNGVSSMKRFNRDMNCILGFLRPKSLIPPEPVVDLKEEDMYAVAQFEDGWAGFWNMATGQTGHIDTVEEWNRIAGNLKIWKFQDAASFDAWKRKYGTVLPLNVDANAIAAAVVAELGNTQINVDALAEAIAAKIETTCDCGCGVPIPTPGVDVTTKEEILASIEANYPEDK